MPGNSNSNSPSLRRRRRRHATLLEQLLALGPAQWHRSTDVVIATGVSQITDLSGNDRHLVQADTAKQPAYSADGGIDDCPYVEFDNVDDFLGNTYSAAQPEESFLVAMPSVSNAHNGTLTDYPPGNARRIYVGSSLVGMYAGTTSTRSGVTETSWHRINAVFETSNSALRVDELTEVTSTQLDPTLTGGLRLGIFGNGSTDPSDMRFAERISFARILEAAERAIVNAYLAERYPSLP